MMKKIDAERQTQAEIFRRYYLLLEELYQEKSSNNLLHQTRQDKLKEAQKEAEQVVPIKFGLGSSHSSQSKKRRGGGGDSNPSGSHYPTPEDFVRAASLVDSKDIKFNERPTDWSAPLNSPHLLNLVGQMSLLMVQATTEEKASFETELEENIAVPLLLLIPFLQLYARKKKKKKKKFQPLNHNYRKDLKTQKREIPPRRQPREKLLKRKLNPLPSTPWVFPETIIIILTSCITSSRTTRTRWFLRCFSLTFNTLSLIITMIFSFPFFLFFFFLFLFLFAYLLARSLLGC